jgi:uncharacterized OB-fold protein
VISTPAASPIPVVQYFYVDEAGPAITATICVACSASYLARRNGCGRCGGTEFSTRSRRGPGTVIAYTTVYRDAPSVAVPFVSVLVDLAEGVIVKGNLIGIDPGVVDRDILGQQVDLVERLLPPDRRGRQVRSFAFQVRGLSLTKSAGIA